MEQLFIDTEFNDYKGALISMALVPVYNEMPTFYEVLHCENPSTWVAANVMPILQRAPINHMAFQMALQNYFESLGDYQNCEELEIVADWPDDVRHLCDALITGPGTCIKTPPLTFRILQGVEYDSKLPHNALSDAIALRQWYWATKD